MYVFSISLFCSIPYLTFAVADPGFSRRGTPTHEFGTKTYYYWPQRSCGQGNIFTPVCHSVHRGEGVCLSACWDSTPQSRHTTPEQTPPSRHPPPPWADTPQSRHPPGADTPQAQTLPGGRHTPQSRHPPGADTSWSRHPPGADTPQEQTPPWEADSGIRSMSGRYASYWNAFLFGKIFAKNCMKIKEIGTRVGARVFSVPPPADPSMICCTDSGLLVITDRK